MLSGAGAPKDEHAVSNGIVPRERLCEHPRERPVHDHLSLLNLRKLKFGDDCRIRKYIATASVQSRVDLVEGGRQHALDHLFRRRPLAPEEGRWLRFRLLVGVEDRGMRAV